MMDTLVFDVTVLSSVVSLFLFGLGIGRRRGTIEPTAPEAGQPIPASHEARKIRGGQPPMAQVVRGQDPCRGDSEAVVRAGMGAA